MFVQHYARSQMRMMPAKYIDDFAIRRYQPADKTSVRRLHRLALEATGHYQAGPWEADLDEIEKVYLNAAGEFVVGTLKGNIVAIGALKSISAERAEITRMRVHPDFQNTGLGGQILQELERKGRALGYKTLCLNTTSLQLPAQRFYLKHGYREINREIRTFEFIYYEKVLSDDPLIESE